MSATHFAVVFDDEIRGIFTDKLDAVSLAVELDWVPEASIEALCIEMWRGRQYIGTYNAKGELAETRNGRQVPGR